MLTTSLTRGRVHILGMDGNEREEAEVENEFVPRFAPRFVLFRLLRTNINST